MLGKQKDVVRYRKIALICLFISIPLNILSIFLSQADLIVACKIFLFPGIILLISFMVISFLFWRCPHCKKRLPIRFNSKVDLDDVFVCPYCKNIFD